MSLPAGTKLGPYEILSPLGAGGMGEVYRAKDAKLDREVAIKVLPSHLAEDAGALARFEREAKAVAALSHPNILAIFDFGKENGIAYAAMELLEGETLRARLVSGPLSVRKATEYAAQIARGLAAAHEKGIVHRDLKPENLFVTKDGRVKILDFGLAKLSHAENGAQLTNAPTASAGTEPGVVLGTLGYMSPEQVRGQPADARSDIFSFGAVLYEMLSGQKAFRGSSAADTMLAILSKDPPDLSATNAALPPGVERVVRHCLEKSPEERLHSAHDLAFDLDSIAGASGGSAALAEREGRRRAAIRPLAAAIAIAGALGLGLLAGPALQKTTPPSYRQLTFSRGHVSSARFAPDGRTGVYSAAWMGDPLQVFSLQLGSPESRSLGFPPASLLAISRSEELALDLGVRATLDSPPESGTLARVPLSGGSPRELSRDVSSADWSPGGELAIVRSVGGKSQLEFPPGRILYETYDWIGQIRVSPRGDSIALIDHPLDGDVAGSIVVVDLKGRARSLCEWLLVGGLSWSPRGDEIWFTASQTGTRRALWAVTLSGRLRRLADAPASLKIQDTSSRGEILVTSENERASILGLAPGETSERDYTWLDFSYVMDLSQDGKTLLFEEWGEAANPGVYIRHFDGSPPVRLGDGVGLSLSPDARWVLVQLYSSPSKLVLLPTGPGEARPIAGKGLSYQQWARFLPDGKHIAFLAREAGHGNRIYLQDIEGEPRSVTPEGVRLDTHVNAISPDGKTIAASASDGAIMLYPVDGGQPRPTLGTIPGDLPLRWTGDGQGLYVDNVEGQDLKVFLVRPASGQRELWRQFRPSDAAGGNIHSLVLSADGRSWFWSHGSILSELFLLEGVR